MPGQPTSAGLVLQPSPRAHSFQVGSSWHTALENWSPNEFRFQPTRSYIQAQIRGEAAARLCSTRHHYFRKTADHFVSDYRTFEFGGRNQCFKLTVFIKLLSVPTHI